MNQHRHERKMETQEAVNKTRIIFETGVTVYEGDQTNISDNVIIATLAAVAFALFIAIAIVIWRCFVSSDNSNSQEHSLLRSSIYTPEVMSVPRSELTRLLRKYISVPEDGSKELDHGPCLSSSKLNMPDRLCAEVVGNVDLPSENFMSYSLCQVTPERLRKSSASPLEVPCRLSSSDCMSSISYRNESLLHEEPIFTSSPGYYPNKRLWKATNLNEYCPPSLHESPGQQSPASDSGSRSSTEYKSFYFKWPEEENDEDAKTVQIPIIQQLEISGQKSSDSIHCSPTNRIGFGSFDSASAKIVDDDDKGVVQSRNNILDLAGVKNTWV